MDTFKNSRHSSSRIAERNPRIQKMVFLHGKKSLKSLACKFVCELRNTRNPAKKLLFVNYLWAPFDNSHNFNYNLAR